MRGINKQFISAAVITLMLMMASCTPKKNEVTSAPIDSLRIGFTVKSAWPHDIKSFTQGLVVHNGQLYESTGQKQSWIGIVNIKTGEPDKKVVLDDKYFGEGITILNNKIYQLTWQSKTGFIYDLKTFKNLGSFFYDTEGWGITHNNRHLIMSDGSEKLTFLDTTTLKPVKTLHVRDAGGNIVKMLNELEYINGFIYANLWETNLILKIDEQTGKIVGRIDLTDKANEVKLLHPTADVLNGIAYHEQSKSLLVTGKYWPFIFALQLKK